jgi:hypothetical protein
MRRQRGVTLGGFISWAVVVGVVLVIGMKLLPSYIEYWRVQSILGKLAKNPELRSGSIGDVRAAFVKQTMVESVNAVGDIELTKEGNGFTLSATWSDKVPIAGNVSAWMDFNVVARSY